MSTIEKRNPWEEERPSEEIETTLLDGIIEISQQRGAIDAMPQQPFLVGDVLATGDSERRGCVLVRCPTPAGDTTERWLPALATVATRVGDRVLIAQAAGLALPIVIGVVDGFSARPPTERRPAASLELKQDEALVISTANGAPVLEIFEESGRPVLRLCHTDLDIQVPGALKLSAERIELVARQGSVDLRATDEVKLVGERIRLN